MCLSDDEETSIQKIIVLANAADANSGPLSNTEQLYELVLTFRCGS
jgi:hypothetical protein